MSPRTQLLNLTALFGALAMPASANAGIISVSFDFENSPVHSISENNGMGTLVGLSGISRLNSLAIDSTGTLYSVGGSLGDTLVTIDPATGASTAVATLRSGDIRGLAFSSSDVLLGIRSGFPSDAPDDLVTIDTATGAVTLIGNTAVPGLQGLAFSPNGTLYGWEVGEGSGLGLGLVTINTLTGQITDVDPAIDGSAFAIQGLAFAPDGTLFGAHTSLFTISTTTGALTLVGSGGYSDVRGIEIVIPEPAGLSLLSLGALGILLYRLGRRD